MKNSNKPQNNLKDIGLFSVVAAITIAALFCTYFFTISGPIKVIVWIMWLLLCAGTTYFTAIGKKIIVFAKEAKIELLKVVWPTRQETIHTTSIVMIMVAATGVILWGVDTIMIWGIAKITHIG